MVETLSGREAPMELDSKIREVFIENLRRAMYERRMTQVGLVQRSGVPRATLSNIIRGNDFKLSTLCKLADALGIEPGLMLMARPETKPNAPSTADTILALAELLRGSKS